MDFHGYGYGMDMGTVMNPHGLWGNEGAVLTVIVAKWSSCQANE